MYVAEGRWILGLAVVLLSIIVTVQAASTQPLVTCPGDMTAEATSSTGAVVTYIAFCSDPSGLESFVCSPQSGGTYPIGATQVVCTCTNVSGVASSCSFTITVTAEGEVAIDVKPGSLSNPFSCSSRGNLPVAILSSPSFDATTVDVSTATLEALIDTINALAKSSTTDVNGDGLLDLIVYFDSAAVATEIGCPLPFNALAPVTVRGQTSGGGSFFGSDVLRIVGSH